MRSPVVAAAFLAPAAFTHPTTMIVPFPAIFGLSYSFVQFGPDRTTFVLPSEVFPVSVRTTGHGIAVGIRKLGVFVGVFLVPQLQKHFGLRGMLLIAGIAAVLGFVLTSVLPEPAQRSPEDIHDERGSTTAPPSTIVIGAFDAARTDLPVMVQQSPTLPDLSRAASERTVSEPR